MPHSHHHHHRHHHLEHRFKEMTTDLKQAVHELGYRPSVKAFEAELRHSKADLKEAQAEIQTVVKKAAHDVEALLKHAAHDLKSVVKEAAHDVKAALEHEDHHAHADAHGHDPVQAESAQALELQAAPAQALRLGDHFDLEPMADPAVATLTGVQIYDPLLAPAHA
jgi:molecular chaperone GrpE (heat shock protein)